MPLKFLRRNTSKSTYLAAWERARSGYQRQRSGSLRCAFCLSWRQRIGRWVDAAKKTFVSAAGGSRLKKKSNRSRTSRVRGLREMRLPLRSFFLDVARRLKRLATAIPEWGFRLRDHGQATHGNRDYRFRARRYAGSRNRRYRVHVPPGYSGRTPAPVVMVLHGCRQTHWDIQKVSAFDAVADKYGFLVVYPFVTSYAGLRNRNCWGWWLRDQIHAGSGEVEDLWQILREVQANYSVDRNRMHVAGLSSGAGMAVALMVARASKIASGAAVAGVPYAETARAVGFFRHIAGHFRPVQEIVREMNQEMGDKKRLVPLFVIHSFDDATVNIQAARNLRDSWAHCFGIPLHRRLVTRKGVTGSARWEHTRYRNELRRTALETLFLEGPGHGWYGGKPGRYSYPQAPNIAEWLWRFFQSHPIGTLAEETVGIEPVSPTAPEGKSAFDRTAT